MEKAHGFLMMTLFGIDNSSSSHHLKNDFLVLGGGDTFSINGSFAGPKKKIGINFSKAKKNYNYNTL